MGDYVWRGKSPRQDLEATIWRWWPTRGPEATHAVDAILAAADTYLRRTAQSWQDRADPAPEPAEVTAQRRSDLGDAVYRRPA
jgi:hypothetical protein